MKHEDPRSWLHPLDCDCAECEPHRPTPPPRLGFVELGWIAGAGIAIGHAIIFALDPAGALWALTNAVGL